MISRRRFMQFLGALWGAPALPAPAIEPAPMPAPKLPLAHADAAIAHKPHGKLKLKRLLFISHAGYFFEPGNCELYISPDSISVMRAIHWVSVFSDGFLIVNLPYGGDNAVYLMFDGGCSLRLPISRKEI